MRDGKILSKILGFLEEKIIDNNIDFIDAVLSSGYGASMNKIEYEYQKRRKKTKDMKLLSLDYLEKRNRLNKFLFKLKNDGLISKSGNKEKKFIITKKGKDKLQQIRSRFPGYIYEVEKQQRSAIVSFDIPECFRSKRNWLREVLKNLGFKMVHKSVWVGNIKIPKQFIVDLEKMNILKFVEIFEVSKNGSLENIKNI